MNLARKILTNTFAQIAGKGVVALIGLVTIRLLAQYLNETEMGHYIAAYEFLAIFAIAADLGLFTIAVKEMSEDSDRMPMIIGNVLSLRTILSVIVMAICVLSAFIIPKYQGTEIPIAVAIGSISIILSILNGTVSAVLQVHLKMHWESVALIFGRLLGLVYLFYVIKIAYTHDTTMGFYHAMLAGVFTNLIMIMITGYFAGRLTHIRYRFDYQLWKEVLLKSLPYGLALILNTIYFRVDSMLIFFLKDAKELAVYGVAMKILDAMAILPLYFMNSILPTLTRVVKETKENYDRIIQYAFDFLGIASLALVAGVFTLAYPIIFVVSDEKYLSRINEGFYGSDIGLKILIFASLFSFLNVLFAFILIAVNQQVKLLYINATMVIFKIVSNLIIIPIWGFVGACVTSVFTELFILIFNAYWARRYVDYSISLKTLHKGIFSALIMAISLYFFLQAYGDLFKGKIILLAIPLGGVIYLLGLWLTKAINKDMLKLLFKRNT